MAVIFIITDFPTLEELSLFPFVSTNSALNILPSLSVLLLPLEVTETLENRVWVLAFRLGGLAGFGFCGGVFCGKVLDF